MEAWKSGWLHYYWASKQDWMDGEVVCGRLVRREGS